MKQKKLKKQKPTTEKVQPIPSLVYNKPFNISGKWYLSLAVFVIALIPGIYYLLDALNGNGYFSFPLDDSWIHLTFAKNLIDYGSFSYYKNEMVTAGSTSPIYTALLSLMFIFSRNEFIISYVLGILFAGLTCFFVYRTLLFQFTEAKWAALLIVLLIAFQPHLTFLAVSGMETTMYIAIIAIGFYFYRTKNALLLGISLGALIWCRPDGFVLWLAILIDQLIIANWVKNAPIERIYSKKELIKVFSVASALTVIYFGFNIYISGYFLPNTFRSKLATYTNLSRKVFISQDILGFFSANEFKVIWVPFIISSVFIFIQFLKRKYDQFAVYLYFTLGLILLFYIQLPTASMYGRYLVPVIPFYFILSVYGVIITTQLIAGKQKSPVLANFISVIFSLAALYLFISFLITTADTYRFTCKYYNDRHAVTGKWLHDNTPENAVIATHDIGALGYYSNRKIVDMVGLVNPAIINKIGRNFTQFLNTYLAQQKVDYVVTLTSWFEVVNDNPLFSPVKEPEIMEVYKYKPGRTHLQSGDASALIKVGIQTMNNNDAASAENYFLQATQVDSLSSRAYFILGYYYLTVNNLEKSLVAAKKAVDLFPEFTEASELLNQVQSKIK